MSSNSKITTTMIAVNVIVFLNLWLCAQSALGDTYQNHRTNPLFRHWSAREEEYSLGYRQCDLYPALRHDCGYFGIDEDGCSRRGCCYTTSATSGVSWCYYARDMIEDQCSFAPGERTPCGEYGIEKEACLAEGCCWQPKDDPDTPWCYHALEDGFQPGAEDCEFTSSEGACSVTCGSGVRTVTNTITSQPSGGGQACPAEEVVEYCHTGVQCDGCGGNLVGPSGALSSPGYPEGYPDNSNCMWRIEDVPGQMIRLTFDSFNLEAGWDYLYISFGEDETISYTGADLPPGVISSSPLMIISFTSDSSVSRPGFSASFNTLDYGPVDCEYTTVESPCSVTCGSGVSTNINTIVTLPVNGGAECPPETEVTGTCDTGITCPSLHDEEDRCGVPRFEPIRSKRMIVGGIDASPHSWPWQLSLYSNSYGGHICGASLLSKDWVLTAAHCTGGSSVEADLVIRAGVHRQSENDSWVQESRIQVLINHAEYGFDGSVFQNDIALIKLETPLVYTDAVQPACLPEPEMEFEPGTELMATGWGNTVFGGNAPDELQQVMLPVLDRDVCNDWTEWSLITENMICVGYEEGGRSSCHGDSGGPLVFEHQPDDRWILVGVTSFGTQMECAAENMGTSYTRVSRYIDWIYSYTESS